MHWGTRLGKRLHSWNVLAGRLVGEDAINNDMFDLPFPIPVRVAHPGVPDGLPLSSHQHFLAVRNFLSDWRTGAKKLRSELHPNGN
ncbi:MAG: hypothetical protein K2Y05_05695 [Hyphomicrobiaceae bacterium]|nr:hypothetical protein [Hyphomicrobiaceae bacterium]